MENPATSSYSFSTSSPLAVGNVAIAISALGYLAGFFPFLSSTPIITCLGVIALLWLTTVANFGGPSLTGRIGSVTVWGVIIPVGLLSIIGWLWFSRAIFAEAWNPKQPHLAARHGLEHLAHPVGLPRHGIRQHRTPMPSRIPSEMCRSPACSARSGRRSSTFSRPRSSRASCPIRSSPKSTGPFALAYAQDVQPDHRVDHHGAGGDGMPRLAAGLAIHDRPDRQVRRGATHVPGLLHQGQQIRRPDHGHDRPRCGAVSPGSVSTISPTLSEQFSAAVNLAVVTNVVPYIISLSALMVMMRVAKVPEDKYRFNAAIAVVAMLYSTYAIYASGKDAVLGGMLMTAIAFIIWGFIAARFTRCNTSCRRTNASGLSHEEHDRRKEIDDVSHADCCLADCSAHSHRRICRRRYRQPAP